MKIHPSQTVGQIAVNFKEAIPVFEKYKIDYATQGGRSLKDACYMAGIPFEKILQELEQLPPRGEEWYAAEPDWRNEPMSELTAHIVKTHHVFVRRHLEKIEELLDRLAASDLPPGSPVSAILGFFPNMAKDLLAHLREEEEVVFPYLVEVEMALQRGKPVPTPFREYNSLTHPIRILQADHGMMGREWMKIEELTDYFNAPPGASQDLLDLYRAFKEMDLDNRKHFHLENNILFHRVLQLGLLNREEENGGPAGPTPPS